jgi:hypothetical protein
MIGDGIAAQKNKSSKNKSTKTSAASKKKKQSAKKTRQPSKTKKQLSNSKKKSTKNKTASSAKNNTTNKSNSMLSRQEKMDDTLGNKVVVITSDFKPSLQNAAKINFTAASSSIDTSIIPLSYKVPSSNLFFSYDPIAIQPLALPTDSGLIWTNQHQIKIGAGNLSSFLGEARFSFGDGKKSTTTIQADYISSKGNLFAQQYSKLNLDVISIINSPKGIEWTSHGYFNSITQYKYGFKPASLVFAKDDLKQIYNTLALEVGAKNKLPNQAAVNFHPQLNFYRFTDNNNGSENNLIFALPIEKIFSKFLSFKLTFNADIANTKFPSTSINNNLFSLNPALLFATPNFTINVGLRPSWDNNNYTMLPNLMAEAKLKNSALLLQVGWDGNFQKNSYRSLVGFNPWIGPFASILNTQINQQYIGIKGSSGNHISYNARISLQQLKNQPLFLNEAIDGKTFNTIYESSMNAIKLEGEFAYKLQDNWSIIGSANFTQFNAFSVNSYAWGLVPVEITGSTLWKPLKDLQVKADLFFLGGTMYKTATIPPSRLSPGLDLNMGGEFNIHTNWRIWLQMNNLFNNTYQRWNQYPVFGFNVMAGVVYSFL